MTKRLENLIGQLTHREHIELAEHIEKRYAIEFIVPKDREEIKEKVSNLIRSNFATPQFKVLENYTFMDLEMSPDEVNALSEMIIDKFDLDSICFSDVMEWQKVSDIINYIVERD